MCVISFSSISAAGLENAFIGVQALFALPSRPSLLTMIEKSFFIMIVISVFAPDQVINRLQERAGEADRRAGRSLGKRGHSHD